MILPLFMYKQISFNEYAMSKGIKLLKCKDAGTTEIEKLIEKLSPDFLISFNFNQKIKNKIISIPNIAAINIHPSYLPDYKGVDPLLQAKIRKEQNMGVTLHVLAKKLDEGDILLQEEYPMNYRNSIIKDYIFLFGRGAELAGKVIENYEYYYNKRKKQDPNSGHYDSWPTGKNYLTYIKNKYK